MNKIVREFKKKILWSRNIPITHITYKYFIINKINFKAKSSIQLYIRNYVLILLITKNVHTLIRATTEVLYALPHLLEMITFNRSGGILNYIVAVTSQHWNCPVCHWITVCLSSILLRFSGRKFVILRLIEHKLFRNIVFD